MGAHKQRWTQEEEAALKAGVVKHGVGKWRTILTDSEFSAILQLRSNVDLKDKWRNISVTANGWGSRYRARLALKKSQLTPKVDGNSMTLSNVPQKDAEIVDVKPLAVSGTPKKSGSREQFMRLENLILEALTNLKERGGSDKHAIAGYIEEQYCAPANLKKPLSTKLKLLTANGILLKVKRKYKIAPNSVSPAEKNNSSKLHFAEGKAERSSADIHKQSQTKEERSRKRSIRIKEASEAAARAIAMAEVAIAEAEEAAREAEAVEAEAEAAKIFAEAAMEALNVKHFKAVSFTTCGQFPARPSATCGSFSS